MFFRLFFFLNELIKDCKERKFTDVSPKFLPQFFFGDEMEKPEGNCGQQSGWGNESEFNYFNFFPEISVVLRRLLGLIEF